MGIDSSNIILSVKGLRKEFGVTVALDDVDLSFEQGKIHALIGKNGSGKSTLVNLITGNCQVTRGGIYLKGEKVLFPTAAHAFKAGIAAVHQENSLIDGLSVAENIFLGDWPCYSNGLIDWGTLHVETEKLIRDIAPSLDPIVQVSSLSVGQMQTVEIMKAVSRKPHILVLDEPTSALTAQESEVVFSVIKRLRDIGTTIIYITHRLNELHGLVDTVSVLRDGKFIDQKDIKTLKQGDIVKMMFGEVQKSPEPNIVAQSNEVVLSVENLSRLHRFNNISFQLYKGEVLGIAGMLGSGRTELLRCIFGLDKADNGKIFVNGSWVREPNPALMKKLGLAFTSEDRRGEGIIQTHSIHFNLCLASMNKIQKSGILSIAMEKPFVQKQVENLSIKAGNTLLPVSSLSGGNQQKVVVGNWLNNEPQIILLDEPSRGIDIQAKQYIFEIIRKQSFKGISSIVVSSELEELTEVCDRVLIMRSGHIEEELLTKDTTPEILYNKCMEKTYGF